MLIFKVVEINDYIKFMDVIFFDVDVRDLGFFIWDGLYYNKCGFGCLVVIIKKWVRENGYIYEVILGNYK